MIAGLAEAVRAAGLALRGALHPEDRPEGCATLVLLGPEAAGFWPIFRASPEMGDGAADPLDRWSERVVCELAAAFGARAFFPFGGPPYWPFQHWARASGQAWDSPVALLVHAEAGLFVSYRAALGFAERLPVPPAREAPCRGCAAPCRSACPVGALSARGYDVARCHAWLDGAGGRDCLERGCAVRRACPVGAQPVDQAAFHMAAFHGRQRP